MSEKPDILLPAVLNSKEISKEYSKANFDEQIIEWPPKQWVFPGKGN